MDPYILHGLVAFHPYENNLTRYVFIGYMDKKRSKFPVYNTSDGFTIGINNLLDANPFLNRYI